MSHEPKHCLLGHTPGHPARCLLPLFAVLVAVMCIGCRPTAEEKEEDRRTFVRTKPVQQRTITQTVYALGACEALLNKTATLSPAVEGQVLKILVQQGDEVKAGQPIVQLDPRVAEANYQEKKRTREGLEASLRLLRALPRLEEQKAMRLAIDDAEADVKKAESAVERLKPLHQRGEIPQQQMFEAELALSQARMQQEKATLALKVAMLGPRSEAIEEAQSRITTARAAEESARALLEKHGVCAPISGVLDKVTCRLGQTLTVGTPIGEVVDRRQVYATVWLPARDAMLVRVGQHAQVQAADAAGEHAATDKVGSRSLTGQVAFVGQVVDPQTGNLPVRVLVDNPQGRLNLGQTVAVTITVREKAGALAVPAEAVFDLEEGPALCVVRDEKAARLHPHIGLKEKEWVEVEGTDLKPGEPVIVEGGWSLSDGTEVKEHDEKPAAEKAAEVKP